MQLLLNVLQFQHGANLSFGYVIINIISQKTSLL